MTTFWVQASVGCDGCGVESDGGARLRVTDEGLEGASVDRVPGSVNAPLEIDHLPADWWRMDATYGPLYERAGILCPQCAKARLDRQAAAEAKAAAQAAKAKARRAKKKATAAG